MTSFKRWFGAGAIVLVALALVACPSMVPKATGQIGDITFEHDATAAKTVTDLGRFFNEDQNATYSATSSDKAVATATVADGTSTLTVTPVGAGTATVTVTATASNGKDTADQTFTVTVKEAPEPVTPVDNPPVARTIPDVSVQTDAMTTLTLSKYYVIDDLDPVTYTAESSDDSVATVSAPDANSMITITGVAAGTATITVTATDRPPVVLPVSRQTFDVTVTDVPIEPPDNNQPRQTDDIPDLTGLMFGGSQDVNLSLYFTDDDGDAVTYTATSNDTGVVTVDVSGSMVTVTVVDSGTARIDVTATDPYNRSVRASFNVEVINQAPMVQADEPTRFGPFMSGATQVVVLSRYFSDPEDNSLTYTAESDSTAVAVSAVGADSTITITAGDVAATTMAMITITANDGTNAAVSHTLTVTVDPTPQPPPAPNNPPMVRPDVTAPSVDLIVEGGSSTLTLSTYFMDADADDTLMYTVTSSDPSIATASESAGVLTIMPEGAGTATIKVTASDGEATSAALDISVTVRAAANLTPRVKGDGLPDLDMIVGDLESINLAEFFEDDDSHQLFYKVTSDDSDESEVNLAGALETGGAIDDAVEPPDGTDFDTMLHISAVAAGTVTVTVVATDVGNKSVTDEFTVSVIAAADNANPAAVAAADPAGLIANVDGDPDATTRLRVDGMKTVIDGKKLTEYFNDANFVGRASSRESGETLTFSVKYFGETLAEGTADNAAITGATELAADAVTVSADFSPTTWDGDTEDTLTLTLTGLKASTNYDTDPEVDAHAVALIATDEYGRMAARVFHVRVNHKPEAEGEQETPKTLSTEKAYYDPPLQVRTGETTPAAEKNLPVTLTGADGYFSDGDGTDDIASCRRTGAPAEDSVATIAWTSATAFTITAKADGTMSVTIDCVDDAGERSGSDTLRITVEGTRFSER